MRSWPLLPPPGHHLLPPDATACPPSRSDGGRAPLPLAELPLPPLPPPDLADRRALRPGRHCLPSRRRIYWRGGRFPPLPPLPPQLPPPATTAAAAARSCPCETTADAARRGEARGERRGEAKIREKWRGREIERADRIELGLALISCKELGPTGRKHISPGWLGSIS